MRGAAATSMRRRTKERIMSIVLYGEKYWISPYVY